MKTFARVAAVVVSFGLNTFALAQQPVQELAPATPAQPAAAAPVNELDAIKLAFEKMEGVEPVEAPFDAGGGVMISKAGTTNAGLCTLKGVPEKIFAIGPTVGLTHQKWIGKAEVVVYTYNVATKTVTVGSSTVRPSNPVIGKDGSHVNFGIPVAQPGKQYILCVQKAGTWKPSSAGLSFGTASN